MPSIKDDSTVEAIAQEFCSNGRKKEETLRKIGYKENYCKFRGSGVVFSNVRVMAAIARIDAAHQAKSEYGYDKAMQEINALIATLTKQIEQGNIQAKSLKLAAIKEKNCITGLQQQVNINKGDGLNINITEAGAYPRKVKGAG